MKSPDAFCLGRGIPIQNMWMKNQSIEVPLNLIVDEKTASRMYVNAGGGVLTEEGESSGDLLERYNHLRQRRDQIFWEMLVPQIGDAAYIFGRMVNGFYRPIQTLVLMHVELSERFASGD